MEVTFDGLAGTLELPGVARAGVLLLPGSGPTDRDWCTPRMRGKNGSGRLLARALAARGYAVLRFEKAASGGEEPAPATLDTWLDDARAAFAFLCTHVARVFIAGHGEGGVIATRLAQVDPVAGVLYLSAPGRPASTLITDQTLSSLMRTARLLHLAAGDAAQYVITRQRRIHAALDDFIAGHAVDATKVSEIPRVQALIADVTRPETRDLRRATLTLDPAAELAQLVVPVLVWAGGLDIHVRPNLDAEVLVRAARDATFHVSPDANHVLKHETRSLRELLADPASVVASYADEDTALDDDAVTAIARWLDAHA